VRKEEEPWDAWCQALSPSVELHADVYGKTGETISWEAYAERFLQEMTRQRFWIESFAARVRKEETITLLCSSACTEPERCHRSIVKRLIEEAAFPPAQPPPKHGVVAKRRRD
jgi:uncharacterized protein YeaO (DUF488 family)